MGGPWEGHGSAGRPILGSESRFDTWRRAGAAACMCFPPCAAPPARLPLQPVPHHLNPRAHHWPGRLALGGAALFCRNSRGSSCSLSLSQARPRADLALRPSSAPSSLVGRSWPPRRLSQRNRDELPVLAPVVDITSCARRAVFVWSLCSRPLPPIRRRQLPLAAIVLQHRVVSSSPPPVMATHETATGLHLVGTDRNARPG